MGDMIQWFIIMAMAALFRAGVHTDVIPYEVQKVYGFPQTFRFQITSGP